MKLEEIAITVLMLMALGYVYNNYRKPITKKLNIGLR